jgi:hypothetical protein
LLVSWPVFYTLFGGALAHGQFVINATFDSTITSDPNAADIENTINSVIALYAASFSDPVTVTINFQEISSGLGQSSSYYVPGVHYSTFRTMLAAAATTTNDADALAHLPAGDSNPVNGSTTIALNLANGRALGFSGSRWNPPVGQPDGFVYLNTSRMNLTRTSIDPSLFDLFAVAAHEIDEVLGLVSALDGLANGDPAPTGDIKVMDLFRYDENGNRSFNTTSSLQTYFSLDGTNQLVRFNQDEPATFMTGIVRAARRRACRTPLPRRAPRPIRRWNSWPWMSLATIIWCPPFPLPRLATAAQPFPGRPTHQDLSSRRAPISCPPVGSIPPAAPTTP